MSDFSHFGTIATVSASNTLPIPQPITHFSDDADGMDLPEVAVSEMVMGTNGDAGTYSVAAPIALTVNLLPNTSSHQVMNVIFEANRPEKGKRPARDKITLTRIAPDGSTLVLSGGVIISGTPATSMASSGRLKTASYKMKFAKMVFNISPDAALEV